MSMTMEEEFKRWTAKRNAQLVLDILQGRPRSLRQSVHLTWCHLISKSGSRVARQPNERWSTDL
jgi:hypothetical protein